jgi:hypothetical protein
LVQDFEDFEQNRNYNNGLIIEISSSNKFKDVWRYFLQYHAAEWLRTSGV